jgi:hypothetical protein
MNPVVAWRTFFLTIVVFVFADLPVTYAQQPGQSASPTQAPAAQQPSNPAPSSSAPSNPAPQNPAQPSGTPPNPGPPKDDFKITPREAQELFHSIDEILEFDSKETGLPIKHEVKRRLANRDEVVSYLTKHMNDEDTKRLRRSELVLKKFGLLPHDFNLETFLVALLREQVAGYYDPKTKTVNLLDWVPMEEQEPVIAHELTHALQDQTVNMEKWMKKGDRDLAEIHHDPTPQDIVDDEIDDVREAVIEGQAQAMMFQYAIAPTHHSIVDAPSLVDAMEEETMTGDADTKVFNAAPIFMKESLTFPYSYGMEFVIKLLRAGGKEKAFAGLLKNPPVTTRQIMQPETYLSGEKIDPIPVVDFKRDFAGYQKFDIGAMGEFDVAVLIEQYAGKPESKKMYPAWRGGYYFAVKSKAESKAESKATDSTGPLGLLYVSRWASDDAAAEFAEIYAESLKRRYKKAEETGAAAVSVPEKPESAKADPANPDAAEDDAAKDKNDQAKVTGRLRGRHVWTTDEGAVVIEEHGDTVVVSESLDAATTAMVDKEVFGPLAAVK